MGGAYKGGGIMIYGLCPHGSKSGWLSYNQSTSSMAPHLNSKHNVVPSSPLFFWAQNVCWVKSACFRLPCLGLVMVLGWWSHFPTHIWRQNSHRDETSGTEPTDDVVSGQDLRQDVLQSFELLLHSRCGWVDKLSDYMRFVYFKQLK